MRRHFLIAGLCAWAVGSPAFAGLADSPIPEVNGRKMKHVYSVVGVRNSPTLSTLFTCTNIDPKNPIEFAVEVFAFSGGNPLNDVTAGVGEKTLQVGETRTIVTSSSSSFPTSSNAGLGDTSTSGAARILTSSTKVLCSAIIHEKDTNPPESMLQLPVFKKVKQAGH